MAITAENLYRWTRLSLDKLHSLITEPQLGALPNSSLSVRYVSSPYTSSSIAWYTRKLFYLYIIRFLPAAQVPMSFYATSFFFVTYNITHFILLLSRPRTC